MHHLLSAVGMSTIHKAKMGVSKFAVRSAGVGRVVVLRPEFQGETDF